MPDETSYQTCSVVYNVHVKRREAHPGTFEQCRTCDICSGGHESYDDKQQKDFSQNKMNENRK